MQVPFLDLKSIHEPLLEDLKKSFTEVVGASAFILGKYVEQFEENFARDLGVAHAVSLNSGTDALIIALKSCGIGPGDEVITAPNSFYATLEAILHVGAVPVFVDVHPKTALINIDLIRDKISPCTKAIIPVHLYGQPVDLEPLIAMARTHKLFVIEDACQAHGSLYQGKKAGTWGDVGCFSFYPGKNLGALGDAGALVTPHTKIAEIAKKLRNHGGNLKYQHDLLGYNSRLDGLQAAFLSLKLKYLDEWNAQRVQKARYYCEKLKLVDWIQPLQVESDRTSNYHLFVIQVPPQKRDLIRNVLQTAGVETAIHYPTPLHRLPAYGRYAKLGESYPVTEKLCASILSLPMHPALTFEQIDHVVQTLKNVATQ